MKKIKIENINNININFDLCEKLFQNEKNEISLKAWTLLSELLKKEAQYHCKSVNSDELVDLIERIVLCE